MSVARPGGAGLGVLALALFAASCGTTGRQGGDGDLLEVVDINRGAVNAIYPNRPPNAPSNSPVCQVDVVVDVRLPDACSGFGELRNLGRQANTFRFELAALRPASGSCGGPVEASISLCMPGLGADPPPAALPDGRYGMVVNGFVGGFTLP